MALSFAERDAVTLPTGSGYSTVMAPAVSGLAALPRHRSKAGASAEASRSSRVLWSDTSERPGLRKRRIWRLCRVKPPSAVVRINRS